MNELLNMLKSAAPALATAVGGPLGGMAMNAIAAKLGVEATPSAVTQALKDNPEMAAKLKEIDCKEYEIEQTNLTERMKADMASDSWLSKNIRPMVLIFLLVAYSGFFKGEVFTEVHNYSPSLGAGAGELLRPEIAPIAPTPMKAIALRISRNTASIGAKSPVCSSKPMSHRTPKAIIITIAVIERTTKAHVRISISCSVRGGLLIHC